MKSENQKQNLELLTPTTLSEFARLVKGFFAESDITPEFHRLDQDVTAPLEYYAPPRAGVWLAFQANSTHALGMAALRKLANRTCELKRWYVTTEERQRGIGQMLLAQVLQFAREAEYFEVLLSVAPHQKTALNLVHKHGFKPCARYNDDPRAGIFFSYKIQSEVK